MDKLGNIEDKEQFSREEVELIISRVRYAASKTLTVEINSEEGQAKAFSYDALKNEQDKEKMLEAKKRIHYVEKLKELDKRVRDNAPLDIRVYLKEK